LETAITTTSQGRLPDNKTSPSTWDDPLTDASDEDNKSDEGPGGLNDLSGTKPDLKRIKVFQAAKSFWPHKKIELKNVALSLQTMRVSNDERSSRRAVDPSDLHLEVNMIVCPPTSDEEDEELLDEEPSSIRKNRGATLQLVRMVNDIPLLDGAEAHSCGIVHGIVNKTVWGSFGLDISGRVAHSREVTWTPTYDLRDSDQAAPFFQSESNHKNDNLQVTDRKRKWNVKDEKNLLPARDRLGNILICVVIRGTPSSLPLPTLSKVSLPRTL
jgi:hypothetical protein